MYNALSILSLIIFNFFFFHLHLYPYIKVIAGLFFPPFLTALDYKSKKQLKLMPQTVEEHLDETLEDDSDDNDENDNDLDDDSIQQVKNISI